MLTYAKIGLVGLVLLASKMANAGTCPAGTFSNVKTLVCTPCPAGSYQPDEGKNSCLPCPDKKSSLPGAKSKKDCKDLWLGNFRCGTEHPNELNQPAECNPNDPNAHCCNAWGWCGKGEENCKCEGCKNYKELPTTNPNKDDDDDTDDDDDDKQKNRDIDESNNPSTTSDAGCQDKICIDFTEGHRDHHAFAIMRDVYGWNTFFVKNKEVKDGRNLYTSIGKCGKMKNKYAMWWKEGYWMVGDYDKRKTWSAFAFARSEENCPEEIAYDWKYSYGDAFLNADKGMSVYPNCEKPKCGN